MKRIKGHRFCALDLIRCHSLTPMPSGISMVNGHGTPCVKDLNYVILGGTYTHLFDVVDKGEHGRKRKVLSAAFALRNLERWEFKVAATTKRLLDAMDRHCTAPLAPGQHVPHRVDVNLILASGLTSGQSKQSTTLLCRHRWIFWTREQTLSRLESPMEHCTKRPGAMRKTKPPELKRHSFGTMTTISYWRSCRSWFLNGGGYGKTQRPGMTWCITKRQFDCNCI